MMVGRSLITSLAILLISKTALTQKLELIEMASLVYTVMIRPLAAFAVIASFAFTSTAFTSEGEIAFFDAATRVRVTQPVLFPVDKAQMVNPDVQLKLTFNSPPKPGASGKIRIYDAIDDRLVDTLDMSIPAGPTKAVDPAVRAKGYIASPYPYARNYRPTNLDTKPGTPSGGAVPTPADYQLTIIGGFTDGFHFFPITVDGNTATIHPHHDLLEYGKTYYVQIDKKALDVPNEEFRGIAGESWTFSTKPKNKAPRAGAAELTVSSDGAGDFNTVQGAMDFVPDHSKKLITVNVRDGIYEEIVYFRNKDNVTLRGQSQEKTVVRYYNNEVFNPHPANIRTNEQPGTFPSRRAAVSIDNCNDLHIVNMTLQTMAFGQAEGLLITGDRNILSHVTVIGSGDALQANGRVYIVDSTIDGAGDTILGRGTIFCERCTLRSNGVFMWPRNPEGVHGNIFKDCRFIGKRDPTTIARSPANGPFNYPFAEVVLLNATLTNIGPEGWSDADKSGNIHFWEYNSHNSDGSPADTTKRVPWSRQLDKVKDAKLIADYGRPEFVLSGWKPKL
jgi:pectin methylesterase-like acyl-CoA thioesterase